VCVRALPGPRTLTNTYRTRQQTQPQDSSQELYHMISNKSPHDKLFSNFYYQSELKKIWANKKLLANNTSNDVLSYENYQPTRYRFHLAKAKTNNNIRSCDCPGSKVGIIKVDLSAHVSGCWIRKKLLTDRFTVNTSVTPNQFNDGYALGVAVSG
jgi:galactose-1-phosphate uridylyltransferase